MASEKDDNPTTVKMVETPLEKAHNASEAHFGHLAQGHSGGLTDAHQAQSGAATAQALTQALGGFPKVGSAIRDPNASAQIQATVSSDQANTSGESSKS